LAWVRQMADEIVPVKVENVRPYQRKNVHGFLFSVRALAGSPCPMVFTQFFSKGSCSAISRSVGFSAPWGIYPYSSALHFVNLLFFAHVEAEKSRQMPSFARVSASSSMIKFNKTLIEVRCRAKPCPDGCEHSCEYCWLGYDQCNYATHQNTYVPRYCATCNTEGFFDPADAGTMCVRCRYTAGRTGVAGGVD